MNRTNIYLADRQISALDRLAASEGVTRAEIIRRLLDRALAGDDSDVDIDLASIDASFGVLSDLAVADRSPGARGAHIDQMWQIRP